MSFRVNTGVKLSAATKYDILAVVKSILKNDSYEVEIVDGPNPQDYGKHLKISGGDVCGVWNLNGRF